jgi:neutral ceramidase
MAALAAVLILVPAAPSRAELQAGAAAADITAPIGTPMFAYTARSMIANPDHLPEAAQVVADPQTHAYAKSFVPSKGIHTRIKARALVLQDGATKLALVQADLGGLPYALTQSVLQRIVSTGIDGDHLLLSATHTHSSTGPIWPMDNAGYAALGGDFFDPRIFELTAQGIADAIIRADHALVPARLGTATVRVTDASRNREREMFERDGDRGLYPDSVNPDLTVLRVDGKDHGHIAVWSNFAIHPTSFGDGNLNFSGDNAGVTERLVERATGAVDVWTNANEGDTSPDGDPSSIGDEQQQYVATDAAKADLAGERVAAGVLHAWRDAGARMRSDTTLDIRRSFLSFDGTQADGQAVGPIPVLGLGVIQEGVCSPIDDLAGPGQGKKQFLAGGPLLPLTFPVSFVRVGRLGVAAFPSEITKQMGTRIMNSLQVKAGSALDRVVIAGLTNAYASYTATPEEYDGCTYEGSFTLFGRQQGARYRDFAGGLATALVAGAPAPPAATEPPYAGFGTASTPPPRQTPAAGTAVAQPAKQVLRYGRATFKWNGGDPALEAPRGRAFVSLQRKKGPRWETVATDDTFADTTERGSGDVWTETYQLDGCTPTGTYRFLVTGRADKGSGPEDYTLSSDAFAVSALTLLPAAAQISGDTVSAVIRYPDPGPALLALPRLVTTGAATFLVTRADGTTSTVKGTPNPATGAFTALAPGGGSAEVLSASDGCANQTA